MTPLLWPPAKRSHDKLVPVLHGSERRLFCVYLISPAPDYRIVKVGYTGDMSQRLSQLSGLSVMRGSGCSMHVFGTLWFQYADQAKAVEAAAHKLLASRRCRPGGEWFDVPVPLAYEAMLLAAKKVDAPYLDYERYVAVCCWRKDLPLDRRIARGTSRKEVRAVTRRLVEAVQLAAAVHGIALPKHRAAEIMLARETEKKILFR